MDDQLIYVKTPAGEEAMQQRTRLVQRNLRLVLAAVDGFAPVDEVRRQIGDRRMADTSLAELERLGLIEKLPTREAREAAAEEESLDFAFADTMLGPATGAADGRPHLWEVVLGEHSGGEAGTRANPDNRPPREPAADDSGGLLARLSGRYSRWRQKRKAAKEERAFRRAYETPSDEDRFVPIKVKAIRRGPRRVIGWPGLLAGVLLLLVGSALLLAVLFPYERYRPEIQERMSAVLRDRVTIAALRFSFLPYPNITLDRVSVGAEPYAQAKAIRVIPELLSLFGSEWVIRYAEIEDPLIGRQGIAPSSRWLSGIQGRGSPLVVRRGHVDNLAIEIGDGRLDGLSGEVLMRNEGGVEKLLLQDAERSLRLEVVPTAPGYKLSLVGNALKIPFRPDLVFEYLEAQGEITSDLLSLHRIEGKLYGGIIEGKARFAWSQGHTLLADIGLSRASASRLLAVLEPELSVEGEIGATLHLESSAKDLARLSENLRIDGEFLVERGVINRFDFMETVRSNRPTRGGYTRFERFSGALRFEDHGWHLGKLKISSGLMQAAGNVDVGRDMRLKGLMELDLKGTVARLNATVAMGGTLKDPQLSPSGSSRK